MLTGSEDMCPLVIIALWPRCLEGAQVFKLSDWLGEENFPGAFDETHA